MSARRRIIARLSEDSLGGIATLHDVTEAEQLLDAYRAEVLREEMRNLRRIEREEMPEGALGARTGVLKAALILDERAEFAEEKATAPAAPATPTSRLQLLLDAIRTRRGRWTTVTAYRLYRDSFTDLGDVPQTQLRALARGDLRDLAARGHLLRHEEPGRQYYTLKTRKDGRS